MNEIEYRENEFVSRAASGPLASWRRHWIQGTLYALIGAAIGIGVALVIPPTYTAETRVAVGAGDLTSGAIAGFPIAASGLASNYARYINDRGVASTDVPANVELSASQIPESNVVRIEARSVDAEAARVAATTAAQGLVDAVNSNGADTADDVFSKFTEATATEAAAQSALAAAQHELDTLLGNPNASKARIKAARSDVTDASAKAAQADLQASALRQRYTNLVAQASTAAKLQLVRTAESTTSNVPSLLQRLGLLGLVVGAAIGLVAVVAQERRRAAKAAAAPRKADVRTGE